MGVHFEWHPEKNEKNIQKHGISFFDAIQLFAKGYFSYRSPRGDEERMVGVGKMKDKIIAVVYTLREENIRVISARVARSQERALYFKWSQLKEVSWKS